VNITTDGLDSTIRFTTGDGIQEVFAYFDNQLTAQGWQQTDLDSDDDEINADYVRSGREVELDLELEGGSYRLEVDIDNDNGDDDDGSDDDDDGNNA
jgi:hypothetical protein